jgi:hypothetical protein
MIRIDVRPANRRGMYTAAIAGRDLCTSRQPFLDSARVLLGEGADPRTELVMRRENGTISLTSTVGYAAELTVEDGQDGVPRFRSYRAYSMGRASPIEFAEAAE